MARISQEREDFLRDARALVPRIQFRWRQSDGESEQTLVAGFRGDALSLYFGDDPAYHFNANGELRRAFVADRLVKSVRGELVAMCRDRSADEVVLQSQQLAEGEKAEFLDALAGKLGNVAAAVSAGSLVIDGQVPGNGDGLPRLAAWLERHPRPTVAASPRVG
jgi:hypothetical protein